MASIFVLATLSAAVGSGASVAHGRVGSGSILPKTLSRLCGLPGPNGAVVQFPAGDGAPLVGAVAGNGKIGVVLANTSDGEICDWVANEIKLINSLVGQGYRVLFFDYRGTGRSPKAAGKQSGAWGEDAIGAASELRKLGSNRIVLVGASTGGIVVLAVAQTVKPVAVIGLSASGDPGATSTSADKGGLDGKAAVKALRVPLLFIAAKQGTFGFAPTEQLYRAAQTADKQLLVVPGQAHAFFDLDPSGPKVDARILDFISTHAGG